MHKPTSTCYYLGLTRAICTCCRFPCHSAMHTERLWSQAMAQGPNQTEQGLIWSTWKCNQAICLPCAAVCLYQRFPFLQYSSLTYRCCSPTTASSPQHCQELTKKGYFFELAPDCILLLHSNLQIHLLLEIAAKRKPARQTARRNSSQTRPQTSSLQTSLSLKLKDISNLQQKLLSTASTLLLTKVWRHYRLISALADCISIHWRARLNKYSSQNIIVGCTLGFPNCLSLTWTS